MRNITQQNWNHCKVIDGFLKINKSCGIGIINLQKDPERYLLDDEVILWIQQITFLWPGKKFHLLLSRKRAVTFEKTCCWLLLKFVWTISNSFKMKKSCISRTIFVLSLRFEKNSSKTWSVTLKTLRLSTVKKKETQKFLKICIHKNHTIHVTQLLNSWRKWNKLFRISFRGNLQNTWD